MMQWLAGQRSGHKNRKQLCFPRCFGPLKNFLGIFQQRHIDHLSFETKKIYLDFV